jgi:hypothetical protein
MPADVYSRQCDGQGRPREERFLLIRKRHSFKRTASSNPSPSAIDPGSLLSITVDQLHPQQTETFWVTDRTRDCRRDGNLRLETTFFSKASYFVILVQF